MKKIVILLLMALVGVAQGQPDIYPRPFLNTEEPERMCNNYIFDQYGEITIFTAPTGGALVRVYDQEGEQDRCLYIFCDEPTHRLLIYALLDKGAERVPYSAKAYGLQITEPLWAFEGYEERDSIVVPGVPRDSAGYFDRPVDVAVSSHGRYYEPGEDFIFVLDRGNRRVVKLEYDFETDSLLWVESFGADILRYPTAIEYADYGDSNPANDDIYVTDARLSEVLRFSAAGVYETSYGGWGRGLASISYPCGVAFTTSDSLPNRLYVADSHNHRVVRYISGSTGDIVGERRYIFPLVPMPLLGGIAADGDGNIYVTDSFNNNISVLDPDLGQVLAVYGELGYEPGQFDYPTDIYIDGDEMQVCELFADSSGIQSFLLQSGSPKRAVGELPHRFALAQNYPNPFNPNTTIAFELPADGPVSLIIYNILGQRVRALVSQPLPAGSHRIVWDGKNQSGQPIASGVYFGVLSQGENVRIKKMLLLK
jgi:hypothetical protein